MLCVASACAPEPRAPAPPVAPSPVAARPVPTPPACISARAMAEVACPSGPRVLSVPALGWPSGEALFHTSNGAPWSRPNDPRTLEALRGRPGSDPGAKLLDAADAAFAAASTPTAQGDPPKAQVGKWRAAATAYADAKKAFGSDPSLTGYALHRRQRALWNAGDADAALAELAELLRHLKQSPDAATSAELARWARADLAPLYADSTKGAGEATAWLASVGVAEPTSALEEFAEAYLAVGRYADSRSVLGELARAHPGASACVYAARSLANGIVERPADRAGILRQVEELLAQKSALESSGAEKKDRERCREAVLAQMVELAAAWQAEAVGSGSETGSLDRRTLDAVQKIYGLLAQHYSADALASTPMTAIPASNRPSVVRIALARAALERRMHLFEQCGASYETAYQADVDVAARVVATEGALACYSELARESGGVFPRAPGREPASGTLDRLATHATRLSCAVEPAATDTIGQRRRAELELLRGQVLFRQQRWSTAAAALRRLAFDQGRPEAREAAALYAIALFALGRGESPTCEPELTRERQRLTDLHCSGRDDDGVLAHLALPGTTTHDASPGLTPCEALRALGSPPPPPPAPPTRPTAPIAPSVRADYTSVSGSVIPEVVRWGLGLHASELRACYAAALRRDPFFEPHRGKLEISFTIARDGSVSTASTRHQGFASSELTSCLTRVLQRMSFSQPEGGVPEVKTSAEVGLERGFRLSPELEIWLSTGAGQGRRLRARRAYGD